jgi:hypothetical protein
MSIKKPELERGDAADQAYRSCLKCRFRFLSEWPGERICRTCKASGTWRTSVQGTTRQELP